MDKKTSKVAFIVPEFPAVSMTFIINQVADLIDHGIDVTVFTFEKGTEAHISERYFSYGLREKIEYLTLPKSKLIRVLKGLGHISRLFFHDPKLVVRALSVQKYGNLATSLNTIFWTAPFIGKEFDVVHCHFGTVATKYLVIRDVLGDTSKFVTTFYGFDVSHIPKERGMDCYRELAEVGDKFLVMSENMKARVLPLGIPEDKIEVHPISIDVESYAFKERDLAEGERIEITSVGRFAEKKGFDDLLRAIKVVREKAQKPFKLNIVGDGELRAELHRFAEELEVTDVVDFKGYMKLEDVLRLYEKSHLYVQASKTARDGDME